MIMTFDNWEGWSRGHVNNLELSGTDCRAVGWTKQTRPNQVPATGSGLFGLRNQGRWVEYISIKSYGRCIPNLAGICHHLNVLLTEESHGQSLEMVQSLCEDFPGIEESIDFSPGHGTLWWDFTNDVIVWCLFSWNWSCDLPFDAKWGRKHIAYTSRTLSRTEAYYAHMKEGLAIVIGL